MNSEKDRLEKKKEIQEYEKIESTSKSLKNRPFSKIAKKVGF